MNWPRATKLRRFVHSNVQRLAPGSLILLYHRIASVETDPWFLCVSPEHFAQHLQVLRGRVVPLAQLTGRSPRPGRAGVRFALTFDDGYADVLHAAKPLLERSDAPATAFVATEGVDEGRPFWWDELVSVVGRSATSGTAAPHGHAESAQSGSAGLGASEEAWQRSHQELHAWLGSLEPLERKRQLAVLQMRAQVGEPARSMGRCLTGPEIRQLASGGLVEIGAHTVSHRKLPSLAPHEQEEEIRGSQKFLETLIENPVTSFAYPHGCDDATSRRILAAAGFERACTTRFGRVRPASDPLRLPRLTVPDCDGDEFARLLRRLGFPGGAPTQ